MKKFQGWVNSQVVDGQIDIDVQFQYEAAYEYRVVAQDIFQKYVGIGNEPPKKLLDEAMDFGVKMAFSQVYPSGMTPEEVNKPNQEKLMKAIAECVDENWKQFFGIALSSFCLCSFTGDPAAMRLIKQMQAMQQAIAGPAKGPQKKVCPYCDSTVLPNTEGRCPCCDAPLNEV